MSFSLYPFSLNFDGNCAHFPFIYEGKPLLSIGKNTAPSCLISSRKAGDMVFRLPNKNREAFFHTQGIPVKKVYSLNQIHSQEVFILGSPQTSEDSISLPSPEVFAREGDGIVSFTSNVFLAVTVADCLPVFLLDTQKGFFAILHSGWKGTGIVLKALDIMEKEGSRPEMIAAVLGPSIQSCCYKVDQGRAEKFEAEFGAVSPFAFAGSPLGEVIRRDNTDWYISLEAANAQLLAARGIKHIAYCKDCTFTDTRLGSSRREGAGSFTRMLAMIGRL